MHNSVVGLALLIEAFKNKNREKIALISSYGFILCLLPEPDQSFNKLTF